MDKMQTTFERSVSFYSWVTIPDGTHSVQQYYADLSMNWSMRHTWTCHCWGGARVTDTVTGATTTGPLMHTYNDNKLLNYRFTCHRELW